MPVEGNAGLVVPPRHVRGSAGHLRDGSQRAPHRQELHQESQHQGHRAGEKRAAHRRLPALPRAGVIARGQERPAGAAHGALLRHALGVLQEWTLGRAPEDPSGAVAQGRHRPQAQHIAERRRQRVQRHVENHRAFERAVQARRGGVLDHSSLHADLGLGGGEQLFQVCAGDGAPLPRRIRAGEDLAVAIDRRRASEVGVVAHQPPEHVAVAVGPVRHRRRQPAVALVEAFQRESHLVQPRREQGIAAGPHQLGGEAALHDPHHQERQERRHREREDDPVAQGLHAAPSTA